MINNIGIPGLLLIAVVTVLLFGRGKVSSLMGELGQGLSAFRKGMAGGSVDEVKDSDLLSPPVEDEIASDQITTELLELADKR